MTRNMYDRCAYAEEVKQSTDPLSLILDPTKFVNYNNLCGDSEIYPYPPNAVSLVDVESSLWGIDTILSDCYTAKQPFCGDNGCLLTNDPRIPPHISPWACERGRIGDNAVIKTNIPLTNDPGFRMTQTNTRTSRKQNDIHGRGYRM